MHFDNFSILSKISLSFPFKKAMIFLCQGSAGDSLVMVKTENTFVRRPLCERDYARARQKSEQASVGNR